MIRRIRRDKPSDRWLIVANPAAGAGRVGRLLAEIERYTTRVGLLCEISLSRAPGDAELLVRTGLDAGYRRVVAVGGDGTVHESINGLYAASGILPADLTFAVVPLGTGNDWAKGLGLRAGYRQAIDAIVAGRTLMAPVGNLRYQQGNQAAVRRFVNMAGSGIATQILTALGNRKRSPWSYRLALIRELIRFQPPALRISRRGNITTTPILAFFAGFGRYCGGGLAIFSKTRPQMTGLTTVVIRPMPAWALAANIVRLHAGGLRPTAHVRISQDDWLWIESEEPVQVQADGELVGTTPVMISVDPTPLRVIVCRPPCGESDAGGGC